MDENATILAQYNICFELGHSYHTNKNPNAEYAIKEGHLAINKADNPTLMSASSAASIARRINSKIRKSGFSSWELLCRRSMVDGSIIDTPDVEIADKKLADKLHRHNPPLPNTSVSPGDLVMISSSKSKIKPRETFIVNDIKEDNGCQWAETYKMANKMVNKPQMVKTEDLLILPKEKRQAAVRAEKAIKNIMYLTRDRETSPTHGWLYDDFLVSSDDDDDSVIENAMDNSHQSQAWATIAHDAECDDQSFNVDEMIDDTTQSQISGTTVRNGGCNSLEKSMAMNIGDHYVNLL